MSNKQHGKVISIKGSIVEVEFPDNYPSPHDLILAEEDSEIKMEVISSAGNGIFYCFLLSSSSKLKRGTTVVNTEQPILIPVGDQVLGRVIDIFGRVLDAKEPLNGGPRKNILSQELEFNEIITPNQVLETGIKGIDFFSPIIRGGKIGLVGGAGVGKTILLTEITNNVVILSSQKNTSAQRLAKGLQKDVVSVFAGVGERVREGHELFETLSETKVLEKVALIFGQMGENPAVRLRTALAGASLAEYFRDEESKDVLFFIDNVFRFVQAGYELSTLMNSIPGEGGYQATLTSEMANFHERLVSTKKGCITSIEAVYVPSDDLTDYGVQSVFPYLDSTVVLSRSVYQEGRFPAIDYLSSTSSALNPEIVGELHYQAVIEAQALFKKALALERIVSLIGENELSTEDHTIYRRAKLLESYFTQNFFSVQVQTGKQPAYVPMTETVSDARAIIDGKYDEFKPDKLRYIGSLKEVYAGKPANTSGGNPVATASKT